MRFGLHFLLSCAPNQTPAQRMRDTIEQAVLGEALGFESVWPVEQHFHPALSIMPCPALLLAAIAERTKTLRLGTGITQLPLAHPLRVAEELATLDVLSGGRVEFGVGRGANPTHFAGFGVPPAESRERLAEALELVHQAWTHERFSFAGRFFQAHDLALAPRPLQRPHPPIHIAADGADTASWAGQAGYRALFATNINPFPRMRQLLDRYRAARVAAGRPEATPDDVTLLMPLYVGESLAQVRSELAPSIAHYAELVASLAASTLARGTQAERQALAPVLEQLRKLSFDQVHDAIGVLGTPEHCIERIEHIRRELRPGRIIAWFNFGGLVPQRQVMRSMERFAKHVLPHVGQPAIARVLRSTAVGAPAA